MLFLLLTVLTGVVYPLVVTGLAQAAVSASRPKAASSCADGQRRRLEPDRPELQRPEVLLEPSFGDPPQPYNGTASGGSNLGPLNPALTDAVKARIEALKAADPDQHGARYPSIWSPPRPAAWTRTSASPRRDYQAAAGRPRARA